MKELPARLGIIAGGGTLPQKLVGFCQDKNIPFFVIGFDGQTDKAFLETVPHLVTRLGAAGTVIKTFREKGFNDLCMIGAIKRPHLSELRPDFFTAAFFAKLGLRMLGDDSLLKAIRAAFESEGFRLYGIHELMDDTLMPSGIVGVVKPAKQHLTDIDAGMRCAKAVGALDIGQSVVIQDGVILGVEGAEGTDELIRRCAAYRRTGHGGILVKICKPQQDRKLDLPTIGNDTVSLCASLHYNGIAVEAGAALLIDRSGSAAIADKSGLFLIGVKAYKI